MGQHLFVVNPTKNIQSALEDIGYSSTPFHDGEDKGLLTVIPVDDLEYIKAGLEQIAELHLVSDSKSPATEGIVRALVLDRDQAEEQSNLVAAGRIGNSSTPRASVDSSRVSDYRAQYASSLRELSQLLRRGGGEEDQLSQLKERFAEEFKYIVSHPQVTGIEVGNSFFSVLTTRLTCRHPQTLKMHDIGEFEITISFTGKSESSAEDSTVLWRNLSRKVTGYKHDMEAPHVFPGGRACLGNMTSAYRSLVSQGQYYAAVCEAIRFIESVNLKDPAGKWLEQWPRCE
jgi:hypothetical protein